MNFRLLPAALLLATNLFAQAPKPDDVLNAERNFAAYAVAHGTGEAFLKFLDSSSVVFEGGEAVNGIETWKKKQKSNGILNWHPVYGAIAVSGDLGFTTGPWTFQQKSVQDPVVARGQYSTLWKKNGAGEWKALVDLGVSNTPAFDDAVYPSGRESTRFVKGTWNNLLNKEQHFISATKGPDTIERRKQYEGAVSGTAFFLNRNRNLPVVGAGEVSRAVSAMPEKIAYAIDGSGISAAGDLGYVYGTTVVNGKRDNYLRIWRREGKEWKLALEVLRY